MTSGQFGYNTVMELDRSNAVVILFSQNRIQCEMANMVSKPNWVVM